MDKSPSIKALAAALNKAQGAMGGAVKDADNPFFKSKYADLGAVIKAIKEPFEANGLSFSQFPIQDGERIGIETILMHESGEWLSQLFTVKLTKQDAQGAGSVITYCRRYALQAIAGVPSEDDDGQAANYSDKPKQASMNIRPSSYTIDDTARGWIAAAKADRNVLNQLTDIDYRKFIEGKL